MPLNRYDQPSELDLSFRLYEPMAWQPNMKLWASVMERQQKDPAKQNLFNTPLINTPPTRFPEEQALVDQVTTNLYKQMDEIQELYKTDPSAAQVAYKDLTRLMHSLGQPGGLFYSMEAAYKDDVEKRKQLNANTKDTPSWYVNLNEVSVFRTPVGIDNQGNVIPGSNNYPDLGSYEDPTLWLKENIFPLFNPDSNVKIRIKDGVLFDKTTNTFLSDQKIAETGYSALTTVGSNIKAQVDLLIDYGVLYQPEGEVQSNLESQYKDIIVDKDTPNARKLLINNKIVYVDDAKYRELLNNKLSTLLIEGMKEKVSDLPQNVQTGKVFNQDVRNIQTFLLQNGYNIGSAGIDGKFGNSTRKAINQYLEDVKDVDYFDWKKTQVLKNLVLPISLGGSYNKTDRTLSFVPEWTYNVIKEEEEFGGGPNESIVLNLSATRSPDSTGNITNVTVRKNRGIIVEDSGSDSDEAKKEVERIATAEKIMPSIVEGIVEMNKLRPKYDSWLNGKYTPSEKELNLFQEIKKNGGFYTNSLTTFGGKTSRIMRPPEYIYQLDDLTKFADNNWDLLKKFSPELNQYPTSSSYFDTLSEEDIERTENSWSVWTSRMVQNSFDLGNNEVLPLDHPLVAGILNQAYELYNQNNGGISSSATKEEKLNYAKSIIEQTSRLGNDVEAVYQPVTKNMAVFLERLLFGSEGEYTTSANATINNRWVHDGSKWLTWQELREKWKLGDKIPVEIVGYAANTQTTFPYGSVIADINGKQVVVAPSSEVEGSNEYFFNLAFRAGNIALYKGFIEMPESMFTFGTYKMDRHAAGQNQSARRTESLGYLLTKSFRKQVLNMNGKLYMSPRHQIPEDKISVLMDPSKELIMQVAYYPDPRDNDKLTRQIVVFEGERTDKGRLFIKTTTTDDGIKTYMPIFSIALDGVNLDTGDIDPNQIYYHGPLINKDGEDLRFDPDIKEARGYSWSNF